MNTYQPDSSPPEPSALQVERGVARPRRLKPVWLLAFLVALIGIAAGVKLFGRSPVPAPEPPSVAVQASTQPRITWSANQLEIILSPGDNASRSITFTSSRDLRNVVVEPVSTLALFITITPSSFSRVRANQPQSVTLTFSIPANATFSDYDGTIRIRMGSQTFPETLKVVLKLWRLFDGTALGVPLKTHFPAGWFVSSRGAAVEFRSAAISAPLSDEALRTEASLTIEFLSDANEQGLSIGSWFDSFFNDGFPSDPEERQELSVNGIPALSLKASEIGRRRHVYLDDRPHVVHVHYGLSSPAALTDLEAILNGILLIP